MAYPPKPNLEHDQGKIEALIRSYPFAHLFTSKDGAHDVTRLPFVLDIEGGKLVRLRAHMNAQNPQASVIDGADILVAFSGPDSYVSPNWRMEANHGATWDYTAVHVWGRATRRSERTFFAQLITDLAQNAEQRFEGVSERGAWTFSDAPEGYVDRLLPRLVSFEVEIERVEAISKLHQDFPREDAARVAEHLEKSGHFQSQSIAGLIKDRLRDDQ